MAGTTRCGKAAQIVCARKYEERQEMKRARNIKGHVPNDLTSFHGAPPPKASSDSVGTSWVGLEEQAPWSRCRSHMASIQRRSS